MAQLRQHETELEQLGVDVKVVTFDADYMALDYIQRTSLKWPLLLDSDQELYRAYGMERGGWWAIYNPIVIWGYLKLIFQGRLPGKPGRDWRQLGGDVIVDPTGIIRLHHISANPHDRPDIKSMLELVATDIGNSQSQTVNRDL